MHDHPTVQYSGISDHQRHHPHHPLHPPQHMSSAVSKVRCVCECECVLSSSAVALIPPDLVCALLKTMCVSVYSTLYTKPDPYIANELV